MKMKKMLKKIGKFFARLFKMLYKVIDALLVTPISKAVYFIGDKLSNRNGNLDKFLNKPNSLISHYDMLIPTIEEALKNKQIQPILKEYKLVKK